MTRQGIRSVIGKAFKFVWWAGIAYCGAGAAGPQAAIAASALKEGLNALDDKTDERRADNGT